MAEQAENEREFIALTIARLRQEEPEWGHLPAAARFKQAIVDRLGVQKGFEVCRSALQVPGLDELAPRDVYEAAAAIRELGSSCAELWRGGDTIVHPEMAVRGANNQSEFRFQNRSGYLARLPDVELRGRSALVSLGDRVLVDSEGVERSAFSDNPEYDPGLLRAAGDRYWMMRSRENVADLDEAFMLSGSHTIDFGHWMIEYLPKLALALIAGLPRVPVLIDQLVPRTMVNALELLLGDGMQPVVVPHLAQVSVRQLWYASNPLYKGFYPLKWDKKTFATMGTDASRFAVLMAELKRRLAPAINAPEAFERVFLARKLSLTKKRLLNHAAIEKAAEEMGFRVIYPEEFSFIEQVQIASNAKYIAAPEGSNTYIAFFASPGCKMLTLSSPYVYPLSDINAILSAAGVDLRILTGPYTSFDADFAFWSNYSIDVEEFRDEVSAMLRSS